MSDETFEVRVCNNCGRKYESEEEFFKNTSRWRISDKKYLWFNCECESTLLIPKGKYNWYSPQKHLNSQAATIFNQLDGERKIPYINNNIQTIQEMVSKNKDLSQIYSEIRKDSILSDQIIAIVQKLRVANRVNTKNFPNLWHSLNYLGKENVYQFLVSAFLASIKVDTKVFDTKKFWSGSYRIGVLSCMLGCLNRLPYKSEQLFIAGSNCQIGKLVLALYYPEKLDRMWSQLSQPDSQCTWKEVEKREESFDSCILGEIGGALWGLSEDSLDVIRFQDTPGVNNLMKKRDLVNLVSLATIFHYWTSGQPHLIDRDLFEDRLSYFHLEENDIVHYINLNRDSVA